VRSSRLAVLALGLAAAAAAIGTATAQPARKLPPLENIKVLTGWDAALMPMLLIGCDGGTNASSGVVPEITRKLYDLTMAQRLDEARKVQYDLVSLFDTMIYSAEFPEGFRAAVQLRAPAAFRL